MSLTKPTIKTLFFSQYIGQDVLYKDCSPLVLNGVSSADLLVKDSGGEVLRFRRNTVILTGDFSGIGIEQTGTGHIDDCTLHLRSIADLTDGEWVTLLRLKLSKEQNDTFELRSFDKNYKDIPTISFRYFNQEKKDVLGKDGYMYSSIAFMDGSTDLLNDLTIVEYGYLLSIGVLLPFTYLNDNNEPITLTSSALITKGWAVLAK